MAGIFDEVGDSIAKGEGVSEAQARALWATHDLVRLGMLADEVRRRRHGATTTYVRVADVPIDETATSVLPPGAGEIRVMGSAADIGPRLQAIEALVQRAAPVPVTVGTLDDLQSLGREFRATVGRLADVGVAGVASAALDRVIDAEGAVRVVADKGLAVARFLIVSSDTAGPWPGFERVRALQAATGAVRAFAPLPTGQDESRPSTGYADAKVVALARLLLSEVPSIQVDWARCGPKLAQVSLLFGADDIDGVSPIDTSDLGWRRGPAHEIVRNIEAAGLVPRERDGRFRERAPARVATPVGR